MGAQIGSDSTVQISKILLRQFCGRYTGSQDVDFYFTHSGLRLQEQRLPPWRQRLCCHASRADIFRHVRGQPQQSPHLAELSACEASFADADVVDAAAKLPPPFKAIRKQVAAGCPHHAAEGGPAVRGASTPPLSHGTSWRGSTWLFGRWDAVQHCGTAISEILTGKASFPRALRRKAVPRVCSHANEVVRLWLGFWLLVFARPATYFKIHRGSCRTLKMRNCIFTEETISKCIST